MSTWRTQLDGIKSAAKKAVIQARNKTFLESVIAAFTMVAHADGVVKPEEKAKIQGFIDTSDVLSVFDPKAIGRHFEQCERQYAFDPGVADVSMLQSIAKLKAKPSEARLLVRICIAIAAADGDFDPAERAAVIKICETLGLAPEDFDLQAPAKAKPTAPTPPAQSPRPPIATTQRPPAATLGRGERLALSKQFPELATVRIGIGWDERIASGDQLDIDASAFLLKADGKVSSDGDFVFYNQARSQCGSVHHQNGSTPDKQVLQVELNQVPDSVHKISFVATIHEAEQRKQNFSQVHATFIRLVDADSGNELARYEPSGDAADETAMIFGELYRHNGGWRFAAVGQGYVGGLPALCERFGVTVD